MPAGAFASLEAPSPACQIPDCGRSLQGECATEETPCRKHALLESFKHHRSSAPREKPAVVARPAVDGPPVRADPIVLLESPTSKTPSGAHRPSQILSTGCVSRSLSIPSAPQQLCHPKAIEFCAGSAGLARALANIGLEAVGVDWIRNRHKAKAPVIKMDLSSTEGQRTALAMMRDPKVVFVHFAPPCGTFTRARDK